MGVVKNQNKKNKAKDVKKDLDPKQKKDEGKLKKKKKVSCLQCFKSPDDGGLEGKYRVAAPELMQDTFMSDSEDEGGEVECPIQQQQQYRYMNSEAGTLNRARPLEDSVTDGHLWPSNNDSRVATIERQPLDIGFLVSFVVDARGGAMKAKRRGGVRIIVPPAACAAPTRVTCRAATRRAPVAAPPPLMEGEALASRLLELQPQGAKFLGPVIIEVPIFTASCPEREIVILRSDTGETWQDHYLHNNDNPMIQEALTRERQDHGNSGESLGEAGERVTRIITCDFPHYLAVVSRVRQEVHIIGPEGGTISSAHIPQVQALFPPQALTKRIRVGLQAHGANSTLCKRVLPRHAAVSPVLTVEPRRRKFHRSITLTAPLPHPADQKINSYDKQSTANLRLLCSIMGGQARAVWEDVTGSTPLTITDDCASFTTTVSARFWLMNCQNVSDATKLATELYREMLLVPFEVRIVVLGKRLDALEGRLLVLYITDRYAYDTLLHQEHYTEVAHSTSVRFLDSKPVYLEFSGNLIPVTKSGTQPNFIFEAFKDNRVEFTVRVKHHEENPSGRIYFMNEPKVAKGEQSPNPACVLDVSLPERIAPRAAKSHLDCLNLDQSGFDALKDELSFHWGDHNHSINPPAIPEDEPLQLNGHDKTIANGDVKYPTKDTQGKETKPHVNGDTLHVDTNKTKATFDSDEDKTPMNTLEKGKRKPEGGSFLGGLADKVKNVFSHSDDKDSSKESSPKPQPKPRESKEKSPPKPAPRIINEDILEKVEDMFKDVRQKPHLKDDDDLNSQVYSTKLMVDEEDPKDTRITTEDVYHQYQHMQPVETPLRQKTTDPFQFYDDCCKSRFKGEKHSHEETSNLVDRIEHVKFTTHEKIHEIADGAQSELQNALNKAKNEEDNVKQQANEVQEDLIVKSENIKNDLISKEEKLKSDLKDDADRLNDAVNNKVDVISGSVKKVQEKLSEEVADMHSKISQTLDNVPTLVDNSKEKLTDKVNLMDFAAIERGEQMRLMGQDKISQMGKSFERVADNISSKTEDSTNSVSSKIHDLKMDLADEVDNIQNVVYEQASDVKENVNNKMNNAKKEAEETLDKTKLATNEKINEVNESVEVVKEKGKKAKSKAEKKSKEGKNFFTGLVQNIFGEKDKIEDEVKGKISESKKSAKEAARRASEAKDNLEESIAKENEKIRQDTEKFLQSAKDDQDVFVENIHDQKNDIIQIAHEKSDEIVNGIQNKKDELMRSGQDKTVSFVKDVEDKKDKLLQNAQDTKQNIVKGLQDETNELIHSAQDKTEKIVQDVECKKEQLVQSATENAVTNILNKKDELVQNAQGASESAVNYMQGNKDELLQNSKQTVQFAQDYTDELLQNAKDEKDSILTDVQRIKDDLLQNTKEIASDMQDKKDELVHRAKDSSEKVISNVYDKKNELMQNAQNRVKVLKDKKDDLVQSAENKGEEIVTNVKDKAEEVVQNVQDKKNEAAQKARDTKKQLEDFLYNEKNEFETALHHKVDRTDKAIKDTKESVESAITDKKNELTNIKNSVQFEAEDRLSRIRQEAEQTTDEIKRTAEETLNAAADKKSKVEAKIAAKVNDFKDSGKEEIQRVQNLANEKGNELQKSAKASFIHVQDSASSAFDQFESAAKDKVNESKDTYEDLQSSARDTFADFRDDVQGLESSAQDTLHSFQSSAGNTFDSLDDSTREFIGGAQNTASKTEGSAKELFGNVQDTFEGFQLSAGNKLEDVKGSAKDRLEEADERLEKTKENVKEGVRETEEAVADTLVNEADKFTSSLNDLGNSVFGISGKGFMKDSSTKLLESEKSQASPSPHKKSSGFFSKLRRNP